MSKEEFENLKNRSTPTPSYNRADLKWAVSMLEEDYNNPDNDEGVRMLKTIKEAIDTMIADANRGDQLEAMVWRVIEDKIDLQDKIAMLRKSLMEVLQAFSSGPLNYTDALVHKMEVMDRAKKALAETEPS